MSGSKELVQRMVALGLAGRAKPKTGARTRIMARLWRRKATGGKRWEKGRPGRPPYEPDEEIPPPRSPKLSAAKRKFDRERQRRRLGYQAWRPGGPGRRPFDNGETMV